MRKQASRGFTLIELMIVVAIIGILSSVALPIFQKATIRTRTSERTYILKSIHTVIEDVYRQKDRFPPDPGIQDISGDWNPLPPETTGKRPFVYTATGWNILTGYGASTVNAGGSFLIEGETYYSYQFTAWENGTPGATIRARGDLDGDGVASVKQVDLLRDRGTYLPVGEDPPPGAEDATTY